MAPPVPVLPAAATLLCADQPYPFLSFATSLPPSLPHRHRRYPFVSLATPQRALRGSERHEGIAKDRTR